MSEQGKIDILVSPEKFFPPDIRRGNLFGNKVFLSVFIDQWAVLKESQFWPKDKLADLQLERFRKLIIYLSEYSAFWASYFKANGLSITSSLSLTALKNLPILTRKDFQEWGDKIFVFGSTNRHLISYRYTSGTSGLPVKLASDEIIAITNLAYRFRHPVFTENLLCNLLSRKSIVIFGTPGDRLCLSDFTHHMFSSLTPRDFENAAFRFTIYEKIKEAAPAMLIGYASLISKFAKHVAEDKVSLPLVAVKLSSEHISLPEKLFISKTLAVPVLDILSCNELFLIGFECPENTGKFHLNAERVLLEIHNKDGLPSGSDQGGEIVLTGLDQQITPVLRYANGDTGRILKERCPCGRTLPLFEFRGRREEEVILPSGRKIRVIQFYRGLMKSGLAIYTKQFQLRQVARNQLELLVVPIPRRAFSEGQEVKLRLALTELLNGEKIIIEITPVDNIPTKTGRKPRFFIPLSSYLSTS